MFTYFGFIILVAGSFARGTWMILVFIIACLFAGSAAASIPGLGSAPLNPAVFALPFLAFRALQLVGIHSIVGELKYPRAGFWLCLLIVWGVFGALFMPRLFLGDLYVNNTDRSGFSLGVSLIPLRPNSGNVTQVCYAIGSITAFACLSSLLGQDEKLHRTTAAVLILAALNILAAFLNLGEHYLGFPSIMPFIRNAQYAIMDGDEIAGLVRISGTFPESSAFAAFTVPLFAFTASLWHDGYKPKLTSALAAVSLLLLIFSTSGTAYVSLILYFLFTIIWSFWITISKGIPPRIDGVAIVIFTLLVISCCVILARPQFADIISDFFRVTVLGKMQSSSGVERSSWNNQGWNNFLSTYGLGVGVGSARASSYVLVLLSNVGAIGTTLFLMFVLRILSVSLSFQHKKSMPAAGAAGQAMVAALLAATVSGTVFDLGMAFYVYAAIASQASQASQDDVRFVS